MPQLTSEERDEFLATLRYGMLTMLRRDGSPMSIPVWFEWTGECVRMFAFADTPKMKRLKANPWASLLVVNNMDEIEKWVAFDGAINIGKTDGPELAERLAARYWDLSDPRRLATLNEWRKLAAKIFLLELLPEKIRTYKD